jgi:putative transposase
MRRSYKFRLRPTSKQHVALERCLAAHRELYNAALEERRVAYERVVRRSPSYWSAGRPKGPVTYNAQSAQLRDIRALRPDVAVWSFSSEQATLRRLNRAFAAFFRRVKAGDTPGYPRFKAAQRFDSVCWPKDGDGCRWKPEVCRVYLQGIGEVKVTLHRKVEGFMKTITVKREARRWYLVLSADEVPMKPLEPTGRALGIDVGIASFLTTSEADHIDNPRFTRAACEDLERAQRVLARKKRGSKNRSDSREVVASRHRKISNQRRDFHHKTARALVAGYDVVCVEKLRVKNMVRRPKPVRDEAQAGRFLRNGAAAKAGLNRSISDAGWAQFRSILNAKAEEAGRCMMSVNPRHTSTTCSSCGHVDRYSRVTQAVFRCQVCGYEAHADVNAARNILGAGLALLVAQAT